MMQYDFIDKSVEINDLELEENMHSYPIYQQQDNHMIPTSDIWQSSPSNSNTNYRSLYFPSSYEFNNYKQYYTTDNNYFDYQSSSDISSTYLIDPYSTETVYNSTSIDSYQNLHSVYTDTNITLPSSSSSMDYLPTSSQWDLGTIKISSHDVTSTLNSSKQPCLVCHEESSGYHFGAYTCESCKAFYGRVTKDPNIEIKHTCDILLPNITKLNRKDCRACRKAKCDQVGMTILPKNRLSRTKTPSKSSIILINNLLEQLANDLTYNQLSTSSALENLLHFLDLPSIIPIDFDYHSVYMNAIQIWRNQSNHSSILVNHISSNDTFAVLLFLFYSLMIMKESDENKSTNNIKFDKLVNILQQEINYITGMDHRLACRIKALFMKCYVALAQYYPNSTNIFDSNYNSQSILPYQQYSMYD